MALLQPIHSRTKRERKIWFVSKIIWNTCLTKTMKTRCLWSLKRKTETFSTNRQAMRCKQQPKFWSSCNYSHLRHKDSSISRLQRPSLAEGIRTINWKALVPIKITILHQQLSRATWAPCLKTRKWRPWPIRELSKFRISSRSHSERAMNQVLGLTCAIRVIFRK